MMLMFLRWTLTFPMSKKMNLTLLIIMSESDVMGIDIYLSVLSFILLIKMTYIN